MITVRTKSKQGLFQASYELNEEMWFTLTMGRSVKAFIDRYCQEENKEDSLLSQKLLELLEKEDYEGLATLFGQLQIYGVYDAEFETPGKVKCVGSPDNRSYNITHLDEKLELKGIKDHMEGLLSQRGDAFLQDKIK